MKANLKISRKELDEVVREYVRKRMPDAVKTEITYIIQQNGHDYRDGMKLGVEAAPFVTYVEIETGTPC